MALTAADRLKVFHYLMRRFGWSGLLKSDLAAAVNAADDWADANAVSFNTALPLPFRTTATAAQKAILLGYVCFRRAGLLDGEED